jgi:hypothetical protein
MALALDSVVKQLTDSGIVPHGMLERFLPPQASPHDGEELLCERCKSQQLTRFQAQQLAQGKIESLLLGNYVLLDRIGEGGMGQVFKALHRPMERVVAIKMLPASIQRDDDAVARFQREARAAARLLHPNIVTAFDADEAADVHFLVMEFVEGQDLHALVRKRGPLPPEEAISYLLQAARGLAFAHERGIVHRDIKPSNLLVDRAGVVKVLDLGLARITPTSNEATQPELTGMGTLMGTIDYMAPEQALSAKHADGRADIYSLGCTLYYLLAGRAMYDGDTQVARVVAHREQPIPKLSEIQPKIPAPLESVFRKMVAKKPADRYQSMGDVIEDLARCAAALGMAVDTKKSSSATRRVTPDERSGGIGRRLVAGILAALALAICAWAIYRWQTGDGTLVADVDPPDGAVEVLDNTIGVETTDGPSTTPNVGPNAILPATGSADPGQSADRGVATWVLSLGGSVEALEIGKAGSRPQLVADAARLPAGQFVVQSIDLRRCQSLADADLDRLLPLANLKSLTCGPKVPTDAGLSTLGKLRSLESLNLPAGLSITGRGLQSLTKLERLQSLNFSMRVLSAQDAAALTALPKLTTLYVYGIAGDETLQELAKAKSLTSLSIGAAAGISDEGLRIVSTWGGLAHLTFSSKTISDQGLRHLAGMNSLKTLNVQAEKLTPAGIEDLKRSLPNCQVVAAPSQKSPAP